MNIEFSDTIKPRITDINYGGHVGHIELINLLHEIRVRFLDIHSLKETDINGHVLMMHNLNITYKKQIFWNNELQIQMNTICDGVRIIFNYNIFNNTLGNEAAIAQATMILMDIIKEKPVRPENFIKALKNVNNEGKF